MKRRTGGILIVILALAQAALLLASASLAIAWLLGRFLTDSYHWSQWLWWIPTLAALAAALLFTITLALPFAWGRRDRGRRRRNSVAAAAFGLFAIAAYFFLFEHRFIAPTRAASDSDWEAAGQAISIIHWNVGQIPQPRHRKAHADALLKIRADILVLTAPTGIQWHPSLRDYLRPGEQMIQLGKFLVITRFAVGAPAFISQGGDQQITVLPIDTRAQLGRGLVIWMADFPSDPQIPRMAFARSLRAKIIERGLPAPDVALGDFNLTRGSDSIDEIFRGLDMHHAYADAGRGYSASFPRAPVALWHIDHIYLGGDLQALTYEVFDPAIGRHKAQRAMIAKRDD